MITETGLTIAERDLLLDMLLHEQRELPSEIRRTQTHEPHERLNERLRAVKSLIEKLQKEPVAS